MKTILRCRKIGRRGGLRGRARQFSPCSGEPFRASRKLPFESFYDGIARLESRRKIGRVVAASENSGAFARFADKNHLAKLHFRIPVYEVDHVSANGTLRPRLREGLRAQNIKTETGIFFDPPANVTIGICTARELIDPDSERSFRFVARTSVHGQNGLVTRRRSRLQPARIARV